MSGSGARGRRQMSFNVEAVGFSRGEGLPVSVQQPTPLYPPMEQKPLPLSLSEEADYLTALKQEFRGAMRSLPCYITAAVVTRDVERYSDKYHINEQQEAVTDWSPDWKRFPRELRIFVKKPTRHTPAAAAVKVQSVPKKKKEKKEKEEVLLKLESLEKKEGEGPQSSGEEGEEGEEPKKEEEEEEEEQYDEEEFEEETDYIMSYFDNGEEFGADSDENIDEAVY